MQIRNRLFSYPVYSNDVDDYKNNGFSFEYNAESGGKIIVINYHINLTNSLVLKKLADNVFRLAVLIECSKTAYRNLFYLNELDGIIKIDSSVLSSKVEVCCLILANQDLVIDETSGINSDYKGTSFDIKRGFIIGYDNSYSFIVDKNKDDQLNSSSIISVVKKLDLIDFMDIDLDNDKKIKIQLGTEMYNCFIQLQSLDKMPVVHSMIVLPALVYVIDQIKDAQTRETYQDYYWCRCILKQLENINLKIDSPEFSSKSSLVIAQELLRKPVKQALFNLSSEV